MANWRREGRGEAQVTANGGEKAKPELFQKGRCSKRGREGRFGLLGSIRFACVGWVCVGGCPPPSISHPGQSNKGKVGKRKDGGGPGGGWPRAGDIRGSSIKAWGKSNYCTNDYCSSVQFSPSLPASCVLSYSSRQALCAPPRSKSLVQYIHAVPSYITSREP